MSTSSLKKKLVICTVLWLSMLLSVKIQATPCITFDTTAASLAQGAGTVARKLDSASRKINAGELVDAAALARSALKQIENQNTLLNAPANLSLAAGDLRLVLAQSTNGLSAEYARMIAGINPPTAERLENFTMRWQAHLGLIYDMYTTDIVSYKTYANHFASASKTFSGALRYFEPGNLVAFKNTLDATERPSAKSRIVAEFLSAAMEVRIRIFNSQPIFDDPPPPPPINTALAKGVFFTGSDTQPLRVEAIENPTNLSQVSQRVRNNEDGYGWGVITTEGRSAIRIINAGGYVTWLDGEYYGGNLHPYLREAIRSHVEYMSITLPEDLSQLDGLVPLRNHVPGTHAEIFVLNMLMHLVNNTRPEWFTPNGTSFVNAFTEENAWKRMGISTFGVEGHAFRACLNCSGIMPPSIPVLSGYRWSTNIL